MTGTRSNPHNFIEGTFEQIEIEFESINREINQRCKESRKFRYFIAAIKRGLPAVGSVIGTAMLLGISLSGPGVILVAIGAFIGVTIWKGRRILTELKAIEDSKAREELTIQVSVLTEALVEVQQELKIVRERHERFLEHNPSLNPNSLDNTVDGTKIELGTRKKDAPGWAAYNPPNETNEEHSQLLSHAPRHLTDKPTQSLSKKEELTAQVAQLKEQLVTLQQELKIFRDHHETLLEKTRDRDLKNSAPSNQKLAFSTEAITKALEGSKPTEKEAKQKKSHSRLIETSELAAIIPRDYSTFNSNDQEDTIKENTPLMLR